MNEDNMNRLAKDILDFAVMDTDTAVLEACIDMLKQHDPYTEQDLQDCVALYEHTSRFEDYS